MKVLTVFRTRPEAITMPSISPATPSWMPCSTWSPGCVPTPRGKAALQNLTSSTQASASFWSPATAGTTLAPALKTSAKRCPIRLSGTMCRSFTPYTSTRMRRSRLITSSGGVQESSDVRIACYPERGLPGRVVHERVESGMTHTVTYASASGNSSFWLTATHVSISRSRGLLSAAAALRSPPGLPSIPARMGPASSAWPAISTTTIPNGYRIRSRLPSSMPWLGKQAAPWPTSRSACLGLAFKPDIDDLCESPAVEIAQRIAQLDCQVLIIEPNTKLYREKLIHPNLNWISLNAVLATTDVLCVLVKHRSFINAAQVICDHNQLIDTVGLFAAGITGC